MAIDPDLKKILDELRDAEARSLQTRKEELADSAEDRRERIDRKVFDSLVKEVQKGSDLAKAAAKITDKRLEDMFKGPVAKLVKSSNKNAELQAAALSVTKETQLAVLARATELDIEKRAEASILERTGRIMATLAGRFLNSTELGQSIEKKAQERGTKANAIVSAIGKREILDRGKFSSEVAQLGKNLNDKLSVMTKRLNTIKSNALKTLQYFTDPGQFLKVTIKAFGSVIFRPLLFGLVPFLFKKVFKGFDKLVAVIRGGDSVQRLEKLAEERNKDFDEFVRLFQGEGAATLKETEDEREAARKKKSQSKLTQALQAVALPFKKLSESKLGKLGLGLFAGAVGGGFGAGIAGAGGAVGRFAGRVGTRIVLPLAAIGFGLKAGFEEFKDTGDIQKAIGEGLVGAAQVLSFGLIDKKQLQDKLKKPFLGIVEGITGFLDGELSPKNFRSLGEGSAKLAAAPFDIAFKMGTNITSGVARFFGAEKFANEVDALFKNFNIGDSLVGAVDSIVKVFTKATVDKFTGAIKQTDLEEIGEAESVEGLKAALIGFSETQKQLATTLSGLRGKELAEANATLKAVEERFTATAKRLSVLQDTNKLVEPKAEQAQTLADLMVDNSSLQAKANRAAPAIVTVPSLPAVIPNISSPSPIIAPLSMRNNENTFRRIMQKDFIGTQG